MIIQVLQMSTRAAYEFAVGGGRQQKMAFEGVVGVGRGIGGGVETSAESTFI